MGYWVVIVDDDILCLTNAKSILGDAGMKVSCLRSGRELLKFMDKNEPDLILLDIMMPEMDGFETYSALRHREEETDRPHTPVIFLTGEGNTESERRGLKAGASDFIRKPFNEEILIRRIRNTIISYKTIESLTEEAAVDKLTGFFNKVSGTERIASLCDNGSGALAVMDLDNFKLVNDIFGHDMGDRVLRAFSEVLRHNTREKDVISRIGGDEFMCFFEGVAQSEAVASMSERMNEQFLKEAAALMGEDHGLPLGISFGVIMVPEYGRDYETLFSLADSELYSVKQNGKSGFSIYDRSVTREDLSDLTPARMMERAIMIAEERAGNEEAILLGREAFPIVYRFLRRYQRTFGGRSARILFELRTEGEREEAAPIEDVSAFGRSLRSTLRPCDLITQCRANQYFVLLPECTPEEAGKAVDSVLAAWEQDAQHGPVKVTYALSCIEEEKESGR
ncbi:MAG: diguanylate cyclase [Lachnospiraceae bacterium]|nr:diguanylate cyclase [Lachnospiraceae bacterium]